MASQERLLTDRRTARFNEVLVDDILSQPHLPLYYCGRFMRVIPYGKQVQRSLSQGCPRWAAQSFLEDMKKVTERLQSDLDDFEVAEGIFNPSFIPIANFVLGEEGETHQPFVQPKNWVEQMKAESLLPGWRQALTTLEQWVVSWRPAGPPRETKLPIWLAKTLEGEYPHLYFRLGLLVGDGDDIDYWGSSQKDLKVVEGTPEWFSLKAARLAKTKT